MALLTVSRRRVLVFFCLLGLLGLCACQAVKAAPTLPAPVSPATSANSATPTHSDGAPTSSAGASAGASPTVVASPTPTGATLALAESVPQQLKESLKLPAGWRIAAAGQPAGLTLDVQVGDPSAAGSVAWVYALVAPFPTIPDEYSLSDLQAAWKNGPGSAAPFQILLVDPETLATFTHRWGAPSAAVKSLPADQILDAAWAARTAWAIVPFEQIAPRWKVMRVDGQSPIQKSFTPETYGLTVYFAPQGNPDQANRLLAEGPIASPNRRPDRLTNVTVTGVTALVRGTASFMEGRGIDYPAQYTGDLLREADILHISNEVSFAQNCPPPFDWDGLRFCSRPKYLQLLKDVGTKVVELTGDHLDDWGKDAFLYTLQLYKDAGIKYYGGGVNITEAQQPALFEHNGNKIAFIGCNAKEPGYAKASDTYPGAWHCDMAKMADSVSALRAEGYQPIVTFQHLEYYSYPANPILQKDFRQMADAGAVIVSGSQAHQPHAMEFRDGEFLHYGLGNMFFDQTNQGDAPRTAFIDRHIFYDGKYINTELLTIYLIDFARSRPMTQPERQQLLTAVFQASGW